MSNHLLLEWHTFPDGYTVTLYWHGNPIACTPGDGLTSWRGSSGSARRRAGNRSRRR